MPSLPTLLSSYPPRPPYRPHLSTPISASLTPLCTAVIGGGPAAEVLASGGVETYLIEHSPSDSKPCGGAIPLCMLDGAIPRRKSLVAPPPLLVLVGGSAGEVVEGLVGGAVGEGELASLEELGGGGDAGGDNVGNGAEAEGHDGTVLAGEAVEGLVGNGRQEVEVANDGKDRRARRGP